MKETKELITAMFLCLAMFLIFWTVKVYSENLASTHSYKDGFLAGIEIGYRETSDTVFKITERYINDIESAPVKEHMIIGIPAVGREQLDSNFLKYIKQKYGKQTDDTRRNCL
jgi:hypothetical protein